MQTTAINSRLATSIDNRLAALTDPQRIEIVSLLEQLLELIDRVEAINLGNTPPESWHALARDIRFTTELLAPMIPVPDFIRQILNDGVLGPRDPAAQALLPLIWPTYVKDRNALARKNLRDLIAHIKSTPGLPSNQLSLADGGFEYRGHFNPLTGNQLKLLRALLNARNHRLSADSLVIDHFDQDAVLENPRQAVKDAATELRRCLNSAVKKAALSCQDPLPHKGRGESLIYELAMP